MSFVSVQGLIHLVWLRAMIRKLSEPSDLPCCIPLLSGACDDSKSKQWGSRYDLPVQSLLVPHVRVLSVQVAIVILLTNIRYLGGNRVTKPSSPKTCFQHQITYYPTPRTHPTNLD